MRLAVELYGTHVATISGDSRSFHVTATSDGIDRFGANSTVLSVAIPLTPNPARHHASRRRTWFAELLPEGPQYEHMLAQGHLRDGDLLGFLARYGRDVAGAVQIWDLDDPSEPPVPTMRAVTDRQVRDLLADPMSRPLGNDPTEGKSSLGGVQAKVVLVRTGNGWAQGLGGFPTTHILKPHTPGSTVIADEEYGARLARRLRLADHQTWLTDIGGTQVLVVERYDRSDVGRVHQEDLSQALGARGNQKYQELGGVVSLHNVAGVLRAHSPASDLRALARQVVFAVGIGNLDLHTKNLSLLHPLDGETRLAPVYDPVPLVHGANDGRFALAIDGRYRFDEIAYNHLCAEFTSWGLRRAGTLVSETLEELQAAVADESPTPEAHPGLDDEISGFITALLNSRSPSEQN